MTKVALVHDFLREYGGAEKVLEAFKEIWPQAPIFTTIFLPNKLPHHFTNWDIHTSFINRLPLLQHFSRLFTFFYPLIFRSFDFSQFQLVISSSSNFAKDIRVTKPTIHISYCHTPPRFLYHLPAETNRRGWRFLGPLLAVVDLILRVWDFQAAQRVDFFIANSYTVAQRIQKFYRRESTVIYPPVNNLAMGSKSVKEDAGQQASGYFLVISRLSAYKNIDLIIKTCDQLGLPLKIIGVGKEQTRLKQIAGPTVEFLGFVGEEEKWRYLLLCRAVIFAASDEDFGIVPVEAMAAGKPVIALRSGGVTETMVDGQTGLFFDRPTVDSLKNAMERFTTMSFDGQICKKRAQEFSKERFRRQMIEFVNKVMKNGES